MYAPAPIRPRKTAITRSRGGCEPCQRKRRKCDQLKPRCGRCEQVGAVCAYKAETFQFRDSRVWAESKVRKVRGDRLVVALYATEAEGTANEPETGGQVDCAVNRARMRCDSVVLGGESHAFDFEPDLFDSTKPSSHVGGMPPSWTHDSHVFPRELQYWSSLGTRERFYLWHFATCITERMPPYLEIMKTMSSGEETVILAAIALGAADLSLSQQLQVKFSNAHHLAIRKASQVHKVVAFHYVGKALSILSSHNKLGTGAVATTHLILSFVELTVGTFAGLRAHNNSVDDFMLYFQNKRNITQNERKLLRGIVNARATMRFTAGPWNSNEETNPLWHELKSKLCVPLVALQELGIKAALIGQRAMLFTMMRAQLRHPDPMVQSIIDRMLPILASLDRCSGTQPLSDFDLEQLFGDAINELEHIAQHLHRISPPLGLGSALQKGGWPGTHGSSAEFSPHIAGSHDGMSFIDITPISINGHDEALEAASYAFCHVMCDVRLLLQQVSHVPPLESHGVNQWFQVLLGIAKGPRVRNATQGNFCRRGVSWLLCQSTFRLNSAPAFRFLEEHLQRMQDLRVAWEDMTFPIAQSKQIVATLRQEVEHGSRIIWVDELPARPLSGETPLISNRQVNEVVVHGFGVDEKPFTKCIRIHP